MTFQLLEATGEPMPTTDAESFGIPESTQEQGTVRFLLPGQLSFPGTAAIAFDPEGFCGATCATLIARAGIAANGVREYDPSLGMYLEQDPIQPTLSLERQRVYTYGDNSPLMLIDEAGLWSYGPSCRQYFWKIYQAIEEAINKIGKCTNLDCNQLSRKVWAFYLARARFECDIVNPPGPRLTCGQVTAGGWTGFGDQVIHLSEAAIQDDCGSNPKDKCLANTIAHEALHLAPISVTDAFDAAGKIAGQCVTCN